MIDQTGLIYSAGVQSASPGFLRLAGHPVRWRLLSELARTDRQVRELTGLLGQPQSLVSYHLGQLRAGGLVSARRSSAAPSSLNDEPPRMRHSTVVWSTNANAYCCAARNWIS